MRRASCSVASRGPKPAATRALSASGRPARDSACASTGTPYSACGPQQQRAWHRESACVSAVSAHGTESNACSSATGVCVCQLGAGARRRWTNTLALAWSRARGWQDTAAAIRAPPTSLSWSPAPPALASGRRRTSRVAHPRRVCPTVRGRRHAWRLSSCASRKAGRLCAPPPHHRCALPGTVLLPAMAADSTAVRLCPYDQSALVRQRRFVASSQHALLTRPSHALPVSCTRTRRACTCCRAPSRYAVSGPPAAPGEWTATVNSSRLGGLTHSFPPPHPAHRRRRRQHLLLTRHHRCAFPTWRASPPNHLL